MACLLDACMSESDERGCPTRSRLDRCAARAGALGARAVAGTAAGRPAALKGQGMKQRLVCVTGILALSALAVPVAQQAVSAPPGVHPVSGRPFAQVMSAAGAAWLDRPERIREEEPDRALDVLKIPPGAIVADV